MGNNNNTQNSNSKKQEYENELQQNYSEIVRLQGQLDNVEAAVTKMKELVQDFIDINTTTYTQAGSVCYQKGLKHTEVSDIISCDMQTEYNRYFEAIVHIKNSLEGKKSELEGKLEDLRYKTGMLNYMIGLCAQDIKSTMDE